MANPIIDLTGERFGRLTVLERAENWMSPSGKGVQTQWKCVCDCGAITIKTASHLKNAKLPSCGCWEAEMNSKRKIKDLTGMRFGSLVVVEKHSLYERSNGGTQVKWLCKCDCGRWSVVIGSNLTSGGTSSCGCAEMKKQPLKGRVHGYVKKHRRLYTLWATVKGRCLDESSPHYARYGGIGITMCDEWADDPKAFIDWMLSNGYDENAPRGKCTIERVDNSKGYYPENCIIADAKKQANNRRTNRRITHGGVTKTIAEWADYFSVPYKHLYYKLITRGMSIDEFIKQR